MVNVIKNTLKKPLYDLKKLPFLKPNYFIEYFSSAEKKIFYLLYAALAVSAIAVLLGYYSPMDYLVEYHTSVEAYEEDVVIENYQDDLSEFGIFSKVFSSFVNYYATPIHVPSTFLFFLTFMLIIAWSAFLVASSNFRSYWLYAFYVIFAANFFYMDYASYILTNDRLSIIGSALLLAFVIPAYAFNKKYIKLSPILQFLYFVAIQSAMYLFIYQKNGRTAIYELTGKVYIPFIILLFLQILYSSKDIANLIILLSNNLKNKEKRLSLKPTLSLFLPIVALNIFHVYQEFYSEQYPFYFIRPIHLFIFASLVLVITSQNAFHAVKSVFGEQSSFSFLILGLGIFTLSYTAFLFLTAEYTFIHYVERMISLMYLPANIAFIIFLLMNFYQFIIQKVNIYYLLHLPQRLSFIFVWLLTLATWVVMEGQSNFKSVELFKLTSWNLEADVLYDQNRYSEAYFPYLNAIGVNRSNLKANYNLAHIIKKGTSDPDSVMRLYDNMNYFYKNEYAAVNSAFFGIYHNRVFVAKDFVTKYYTKLKTAKVANNLSHIFRRINQSDSALFYLQKASENARKDINIQANYAMLNLKYNDFDRAKKTIEDALNFGVNDKLVSVATYATLKYGIEFEVPDYDYNANSVQNNIYSFLNYVQYHYFKGNLKKADSLARKFAKFAENPLVINVLGLIELKENKIKLSKSRFDYLYHNYSALSSFAAHNFATNLYLKNAPEMAEIYFQRAAGEGFTFDSLRVAQMQILQGKVDTALSNLQYLKNTYAGVLGKETSRNLEILNSILADSLPDSKGKPDDYYIYLKYLKSTFNAQFAAENYKQIIDKFPKNQKIREYLADVLINNHDSLVLEILENTNQKYANYLKTKANLNLGKLPIAEKQIETLKFKKAEKYLLLSELNLKQKKYKSAEQYARKALKINPLDIRALVLLADALYYQQKWAKAYDYFFNLTELNPHNWKYWYYLVKLSKEAYFPEDVPLYIDDALNNCYNESIKPKIKAEMEEWVEKYKVSEENTEDSIDNLNQFDF